MSTFQTIKQAIARLGLRGAEDLARRKYVRRKRYQRMKRYVPMSNASAVLRDAMPIVLGEIRAEESALILARAEAILRDENIFFTFPYATRGIERPWEFDPLEKKYWPTRHYTERHLHADDTPRDVKIVWEINRFKDLPTLGQAALITRDKRYADEVERRLLSWIEENPFAKTINWASALEISIRLLSWTTTLILLRAAGFDTHAHPKIARSIFKQAAYLAGDLSTDKVVPTNHLIGEVAGLFVVSTVWDFLGSAQYKDLSRKILEEEILRQTYPDGATREATSWYHQFVTHFFDLAERVASQEGKPMSSQFTDRLSKMKTYLEAMTFNGEFVRYGDADDGWALFFEGDIEAWKRRLFGARQSSAALEQEYFPVADQCALHFENSFLFLRAGEFGMGGDGSSSHAHDDFLSPILFLDGLPVLTYAGTYVYNGNKKERSKYRGAEAHNGLLFGGATGAIQRMNFGWHKVRPNAHIRSNEFGEEGAVVIGQYGERPIHTRKVELRKRDATLIDTFDRAPGVECEWRLHLHPKWALEETTEAGNYGFSNAHGDQLMVVLSESFDSRALQPYDFSPSYGVEQPAAMIRLTKLNPLGNFEIRFSVNRLSA